MSLKDEPYEESMKKEPSKLPKKANRYAAIIEKLFFAKYQKGMREVPFEREEMERFASKLKIQLPKNLGDIVYSFRYRTMLPDAIASLAAKQETWIIRPASRADTALLW